MTDYLAFLLICLLGAMSPGADFAVVTRFAITGSRNSALLASCGVGCALCIHVIYCLLGIGLFIQSSPVIFKSMQIIGSIYLGYLGIKLLWTKNIENQTVAPQKKGAFLAGFTTNLLNPKATLFVLSLFTQVLSSSSSKFSAAFYGISMAIITMGWFSFVSLMMTTKKILHKFQTYQLLLSKFMGLCLLGLAFFILFTSSCI